MFSSRPDGGLSRVGVGGIDPGEEGRARGTSQGGGRFESRVGGGDERVIHERECFTGGRARGKYIGLNDNLGGSRD